MVDNGTADEALLAQCLDSLIEEALVRFVVSGNDQLVGTGFLVAPGIALTCHHVIESALQLEVTCGDVRARVIEVAGICPSLDLALVRLDEGVGIPIAASGTQRYPATLVGRAAVKPSTGILGSAPFELAFRGKVSVQYLPDGRVLDSAIDLSGKGVAPGASGSPVVDPRSRAAVAVIVGGNPAGGMDHVWAVPLYEAATAWPALAMVLRWNGQAKARYSTLLNGAGAHAMFSLLARQKHGELESQGRFLARLDVSRAVMMQPLSGFLASDKTVMVITGPSNVGKSWALSSFVLDSVPGNARCLIEASGLGHAAPPLSEQLRNELARTIATCCDHAVHEDILVPAELLGPALRVSGVATTVVIDGLNEAPDQASLIDWLQKAIGWSKTHGIKLVLSCREEVWPDFFSLFELDHHVFFLPAPKDSAENTDAYDFLPAPKDSAENTDAYDRPCFKLSDFSADEATEAALRYGVKAAAIGTHPLLYRIAQVMQDLDAATVGRFRVLRRYVERQLSMATRSHVSGQIGKQSVRNSLVALANAIKPGGRGAVPMTLVLGYFESHALVDALVREGLLSYNNEYVRFRYDQFGDVLRTVNPAMLHAFACDRASCDRSAVSLATVATLRFENEGPQQYFESAIAALIAALDGMQHPAITVSALTIVHALPRARQSYVVQLCRQLAAVGDFVHDDDIVTTITDGPLDIDLQIELLLMLAKRLTGDETGHPVRMKDWTDPDRRPEFLAAVEHDSFASTPERCLFRLLKDQWPVVMPLLVRALADTRPIQAEATVASLCAGLLFAASDAHVAPLLRALLDSESTYAQRELINALIQAHPTISATQILGEIASGMSNDTRLNALLELHRRYPDSYTMEGLKLALRQVRDDRGRLALSMHLAEYIRRSEPEEIDVWHYMCDNFTNNHGTSPGSIPNPVFDQALAWIVERGIPFAHFVCVNHMGTLSDQQRLVDAVRAAVDASAETEALAWLLEYKLGRLATSQALQAPWLSYTAELSAKAGEIRSHFARLVFSTLASPWELFLRNHLLASAADNGDIEVLMRSCYPLRHGWQDDATGEWLGWVTMFRAVSAEAVDRFLWHVLAQWATFDPDDAQTLAAAHALMAFWRHADVPSTFSTELLVKQDAAEHVGTLLAEMVEHDEE